MRRDKIFASLPFHFVILGRLTSQVKSAFFKQKSPRKLHDFRGDFYGYVGSAVLGFFLVRTAGTTLAIFAAGATCRTFFPALRLFGENLV